MKKLYSKITAVVISAAAMTGCIADEPLYSAGEGTIYISTRLSSDVKARSRADIDTLAQSCDIWIAASEGIIRKFEGIADVPAQGIRLNAGQYKALLWAGDSLPASWEKRYFKGEVPFTVTDGSRTSVEIIGKIANTVVAVNFDPSVAEMLADYTMTVGHSQGRLVFDASTADAKGYFMMNSRDKDLAYTLQGTMANGQTFTHTASISACRPATLYTLNVRCSEDPVDIGGAYFTIEVDETTVDHEENIAIDAAPEISGIKFNINQSIRSKSGAFENKSIWITATSAITGLTLGCEQFPQLLGIGSTTFDFFRMDAAIKRQINEAGIEYIYNENPQTNGILYPTIKLTFREEFLNTLPDGNYEIAISVADSRDRHADATLNIVISDDPFAVNDIVPADIWATHVALSLVVTQDGIDTPVIQYRKKGTDNWNEQPAALASRATHNIGDVLTAELTGLVPATAYEYYIQSGDFSTPVAEFTTDAAPQLPNSNFEQSYLDGKIYYFNQQGAERFWDSGNKGAVTIGNSNTTPCTDIKHGNQAVSLESKFIGFGALGQFAAGNIFAGEFLGTQGMNGILGWGRPFTARPRQLKVWAHYTPVKINNGGANAGGLNKGDMDEGIIYIGLIADKLEEPSYNSTYPIIIRTASAQLYSPKAGGKDHDNTIAYGEHVFIGATPGSELVEVVIDLEYYDTNRIPSYIILTASASRAGDYFTGGEGSRLVIDDLELVY